MVDASRFDLEGNIKMTKELADYAHARGVSVEGEIGCLGASEDGKIHTRRNVHRPGTGEGVRGADGD